MSRLSLRFAVGLFRPCTQLLIFFLLIGCLEASQGDGQLNDENYELKGKAIAQLRSVLPSRRGVRATSFFISGNEERKIPLRWLIESSQDGQHWRLVVFGSLIGREAGSLNAFANEILANDDQIIAAMIEGDFEESEVMLGFKPGDNFSSVPLLLDGNIKSRGGEIMASLAIVFGFVPDKSALPDIHSDSFADGCQLNRIAGGISVLTHRGSEIEFSFSPTWDLINIKWPTYRFGSDLSLTQIDTTIVTFSEIPEPHSNKIAFRVEQKKAEFGQLAIDYVVSWEDLDPSVKFREFIHANVQAGQIVVRMGQSTNDSKPLYYNAGRASFLIDPVAEHEIEAILRLKNQSTQNHREFLWSKSGGGANESLARYSYLRSSDSTDCGLYSLAIAAAQLGVEIPLDQLLASEEFASGNGSSLNQLRSAAAHFNLDTKSIRFGNVDHLLLANRPAIIHCGDSHQTSGISHWAAVLEVDAENKRVLLADLPLSPAWVSEAELMTTWDGTAILISDDLFSGSEMRRVRWLPLVRPAALGLSIAVCLILLRINRPQWFAQRDLLNRANLIPFFVILAIALLLAAGWSHFSRLSYFLQPDSVALVDGKIPRLPIAESDNVTELWAWKDWQDDDQSVVIDARIPRDYHRGHVAGSINLPVDCTLLELRNAWQAVKNASQCVIYCQSENCSYAHQIASRLAAMGAGQIVIYRPGFIALPEELLQTDPVTQASVH